MTDQQLLEITHHSSTAVSGIRDELVDVHCDARAQLLEQPFYLPERFGERFERYLTRTRL